MSFSVLHFPQLRPSAASGRTEPVLVAATSQEKVRRADGNGRRMLHFVGV